MRRVRRAFVLSAMIMCFSFVASADPLIDFVISGVGGSVSYAGGSAPLLLSGLPVSSVLGKNGTPLNNGVSLACISCTLNATTGPSIGGTSADWSFASGGAFSIAGTLMNGSSTVASGTLLAGSFGSSTTVFALPFLSSTFGVVISLLSSGVHPGLTGFYGMPSTPPNYSGNMNISFITPGVPPSAFTSSTVVSGNVSVQTPEPLSIILLGTVILGCAALIRRRQRAQI